MLRKDTAAYSYERVGTTEEMDTESQQPVEPEPEPAAPSAAAPAPAAEEMEPPASAVERADVEGGAGAALRRMHSDSLVKVDAVSQESTFNPFVNQTPHPGAVEWIKMILLLPLAIVRVVLIVVLLLLCAPFAYLALCGYDPGEDARLPKTLSCWRKMLYFPIRIATRGVLLCLGFWWISEKGTRAPPTEAPLLLPNHLGAIEPLYLMCRYGVSHVAKADIINYPLVGPLAKGVQQVFVRRGADERPIPGTHSAKDVRDVIEARAKNMGKNNFPQLCLYPEATTTNGQSVIDFKLGAFCKTKSPSASLPCRALIIIRRPSGWIAGF